MVVGITGGIGSGKTTVVKMFAEFDGVVTYIADEEAKKLMNTSVEIKKKLIEEFSEEVYINNTLNSAFLAAIVFKNKEKLAKLNAIVHPLVYKHFNEFIKRHKQKKYIIYENAILFENGSDELCDKIITVTAPLYVKIKRVALRDNTTTEAVEKRMNNQWPDTKKLIQSNYVVFNEILDHTKDQVFKIHKKLT